MQRHGPPADAQRVEVKATADGVGVVDDRRPEENGFSGIVFRSIWRAPANLKPDSAVGRDARGSDIRVERDQPRLGACDLDIAIGQRRRIYTIAVEVLECLKVELAYAARNPLGVAEKWNANPAPSSSQPVTPDWKQPGQVPDVDTVGRADVGYLAVDGVALGNLLDFPVHMIPQRNAIGAACRGDGRRQNRLLRISHIVQASSAGHRDKHIAPEPRAARGCSNPEAADLARTPRKNAVMIGHECNALIGVVCRVAQDGDGGVTRDEPPSHQAFA